MIRLALAGALLVGGCVAKVAERCPGCTVMKESQRTLPPATGARSLVVLVHGAFGFGSEWDPVVDVLRRSQDVGVVAFEWRGPFHELSGAVGDLAKLVQRELDGAPELEQVLVLAHSAGGPLAARAMLELRVPDGRRVLLAEIDSPTFMSGPPMFRTRLRTVPPMPPGVERVVYVARDAPRVADGRIYLGRSVSHDQAVAVVGLPLIAQLRQEWTP